MSGDWKNCSLGEVITLQRGFDLPKQQRGNGDVPIVSSSGISGIHNIAKVSAPGVVTGRYGTLGKSFYITEDFWPLNTTLFVRDFKGNDPRFISYLLKTLGFENQNVAGAVPGVNRNFLHMLPVKLPPLDEQIRISSTLSAYDDLIENNTRRIRILEEMAQSLYREWFVHFRFPGHEKVKLVKSPLGKIPEGWEVKSFGELFDIKYGKNLPTKEISDNGTYPVYGAGSVIGYYDKSICTERVALVTCRGNGSGTIWRTRGAAFITNNSFLILPKKNNKIWEFFWVELLAQHSNINGVISGSAQPQITIEGLSTVSAVVPHNNIVSYFCDLVRAVPSLVDSLYLANENLRHTRDLLLPKLINGKLRV